MQQDAKKELQEVKQYIYSHYNSIPNIDGKVIKILLGSKVTNEGITFSNVGQCHIFDNSFNMSKINQINGRVIRYCQHKNKQVILKQPEQVVHLYRYSASEQTWQQAIEKGEQYNLSLEEKMIKKSEQKYIEMTRVHKLLKINAIDCPFFYDLNINKKLIELYKDCKEIYLSRSDPNLCPIEYDFTDFKCSSTTLNKEFCNSKKMSYNSQKIKDKDLESQIFFKDKEITELTEYKSCIRKIFKKSQQYTYSQIIQEVLNQLDSYQKQNLNHHHIVYALNSFVFKDVNTMSTQKDFLTNFLGELGFLIVNRDRDQNQEKREQDHRENIYIFKSIQELQLQNLDQLLTLERNNRDLNLLFDNTAIISTSKEAEEFEYYYNQEYINQKPRSFFQAIIVQLGKYQNQQVYESISDRNAFEIKFDLDETLIPKEKLGSQKAKKARKVAKVKKESLSKTLTTNTQTIGKKYTKNIKNEERKQNKRKKNILSEENSITSIFHGKNLNSYSITEFEELFKSLIEYLQDQELSVFIKYQQQYQQQYRQKNQQKNHRGYYKDVLISFLIELEVNSDNNLYLIVPTNHELLPFPLNRKDLLGHIQYRMQEIQSILGLRESYNVVSQDFEIQIHIAEQYLQLYLSNDTFEEFINQIHFQQLGTMFKGQLLYQ